MWSLITALAYRWLKFCKVNTSMWFWKKNAPFCCVLLWLARWVFSLTSPSWWKGQYKPFWWCLFLIQTSYHLFALAWKGIIPERSLYTFSSWTSIGSTQIGILTLKQDFDISTILLFGMGGERSRKIRTVGINNPLQNCVHIFQWFAVQHWRTE